MQGSAAFRMVREHNEELLREASRLRLARELRAVRREKRLRRRGHVRAALQATLRVKSPLRSAGRGC